MRFLGLQLEGRVPDAKTVWLFRERIKQAGMIVKLFSAFHVQLAKQGYVAQSGRMIDAAFVEVPRQRNTREENASIKEGETPEEWRQRCQGKRQKCRENRSSNY
jgi:IS5 family transposase